MIKQYVIDRYFETVFKYGEQHEKCYEPFSDFVDRVTDKANSIENINEEILNISYPNDKIAIVITKEGVNGYE